MSGLRQFCSLIPSRMDAIHLPIKSFYVSRSIDINTLLASHYGQHRYSLQKDSVVIVLDGDRYMVVFAYGAVVFFHYDMSLVSHLRAIRECSESPYPAPRSEDYAVAVHPDLDTWYKHGPGQDGIAVQNLDLSNLLVISQVLGQTVALHHYENRVDNLLSTFSELNNSLERGGPFPVKTESLHKLVAENNKLLTDVITKIGILDRFTVAWNQARYSTLYESLRSEFELAERFKHVDFKLGHIHNFLRFFLDLQNTQKSTRLEWIIISLIFIEVLISVQAHYLSADE